MKKIITTLIFGCALCLAIPSAQAQTKEQQKEINDISQKEMLALNKDLHLDEQEQAYVARYIMGYHYSMFWAKEKGTVEETKAKAKEKLMANMKNTLSDSQLAQFNKLKQDVISDY